jgi:hypothetical protein
MPERDNLPSWAFTRRRPARLAITDGCSNRDELMMRSSWPSVMATACGKHIQRL